MERNNVLVPSGGMGEQWSQVSPLASAFPRHHVPLSNKSSPPIALPLPVVEQIYLYDMYNYSNKMCSYHEV